MTEPIRVAQVVGKMVGGGVEAVVMNYYRHIDRSKVQFDFLVDSDSTLVPRDEIESLGGRVFEIPPYQHVVEYQRELQRLYKQEGWKIVHSHINALSVFPLRAAKKAGVPVRIAHSHSTSGKGEYAKNALKAVLKTQSNRYPTHRFACSKFAGEWLFGKASHFEVVYNAIDLERFRFNAEARAQARADLGLVGVEAQVSGLPCLFSDTITREVDVTGNNSFLSIEDSDSWAYSLQSLSVSNSDDRRVDLKLFSQYDICSQSYKLQREYLDFNGV